MDDIHMDFIVKLPRTVPEFKGGPSYDSILGIKCRGIKCVRLIATNETIEARQTARLYVEHWVWALGLSKSVTTDRGPQFHNAFMEHIYKI